MKPWPAILAKLYPLSPDRWAERPWWRSDEPDDPSRSVHLERTDRTFVSMNRNYGKTPDDAQKRARAIDNAIPLPFPGLRVGQTWAVNVTETDAAVFTITAHDAEHEEQVGTTYPGKVLGPADRVSGRGIWRRRPWYAGGSWITDAELLDLCKDGYLLADVVCPHLAPWAGAATPCATCEGTGTPKPGNAGKPGKDDTWVCIVCNGSGREA